MTAITEAPAPRLSTAKIVFLVVAAAAPIGAMTALTPLQYALGNGAGAPVSFVIAGLVLFCFSAGYAAMARQVTNTGGFYTFIVRGLGRPAGVAGSFIAIIAYTATCLQVVAAIGYLSSLVLNPIIHLNVPWYAWTLIGAIVSTILSYRSVDLSAKVLGLLVALEIGVLLLVEFAVIHSKGVATALPLQSFSAGTAFAPGLPIALLLAFSSFVGFESAALYSEEAEDPKRTIPRAIYASLLVITAFYTLTCWVGVGAAGADQIHAVATLQLGDYWPTVASQFVGPMFGQVFGILLCTSLFAALLSLQNAGARYLFCLGREQVLTRWLGALHPRFGSPARAVLILGVLNVLVPGAFYIAGLDPYLTLVSSMTGLSVLGIITLQALACASIISYFHLRGNPGAHAWKTLTAPLLGLIGFVVAVTLALANFSLITGTTSPLINSMPVLILLAIVGGLWHAARLKANRPDVYAELASDTHARPNIGTAAMVPA